MKARLYRTDSWWIARFSYTESIPAIVKGNYVYFLVERTPREVIEWKYIISIEGTQFEVSGDLMKRVTDKKIIQLLGF